MDETNRREAWTRRTVEGSGSGRTVAADVIGSAAGYDGTIVLELPTADGPSVAIHTTRLLSAPVQATAT